MEKGNKLRRLQVRHWLRIRLTPLLTSRTPLNNLLRTANPHATEQSHSKSRKKVGRRRWPKTELLDHHDLGSNTVFTCNNLSFMNRKVVSER
jgi:hypothetical protein